jgi:hypothetical protein
MTSIVGIDAFKQKTAAKRCFAAWQRRFGLRFDPSTRFSDLPDAILLTLSRPGQEAAAAFWELILGALGLGGCQGFDELSPDRRMAVVDSQLYLADQARFELMVRLGWVADYPGAGACLLDLVLGLGKAKNQAGTGHCLRLAASHPDYPAYEKLTPGDREMFIRRLLPLALEVFRLRLEG